MLNLLQRAKLARELAAKVQDINAIPAPAPGVSVNPVLLMQRARLANEVIALLAELGGEGPFAEAHAYFKANMQGKTVLTAAGPVLISGASWREMKRGMKADGLKAALVPHVIEILTKGEYHGRKAPTKERADLYVAFHFFTKTVSALSLTVEAGVNVAERPDGQLVYGLGHELEARWAKRKGTEVSRGQEPRGPAPSKDVSALDGIMGEPGAGVNKKPAPLLALGKEPRVEAGPDSVSAVLHKTLAEDGAGINIVILKVIDKDGNRHPELEDGIEGPDAPADTAAMAHEPAAAVDPERALLEQSVELLRAAFADFRITLAENTNFGTGETRLTMALPNQIGKAMDMVFNLSVYRGEVKFESVEVMGKRGGTRGYVISDGAPDKINRSLREIIDANAYGATIDPYRADAIDPKPTPAQVGAGKRNGNWHDPVALSDGRTGWTNGHVLLMGEKSPFPNMERGAAVVRQVSADGFDKVASRARAAATNTVQSMIGVAAFHTTYQRKGEYSTGKSRLVALLSGDDVVTVNRDYLALALNYCANPHITIGGPDDVIRIWSADGKREAFIAPRKIDVKAADLLAANEKANKSAGMQPASRREATGSNDVENAPAGTGTEDQAASAQAGTPAPGDAIESVARRGLGENTDAEIGAAKALLAKFYTDRGLTALAARNVLSGAAYYTDDFTRDYIAAHPNVMPAERPARGIFSMTGKMGESDYEKAMEALQGAPRGEWVIGHREWNQDYTVAMSRGPGVRLSNTTSGGYSKPPSFEEAASEMVKREVYGVRRQAQQDLEAEADRTAASAFSVGQVIKGGVRLGGANYSTVEVKGVNPQAGTLDLILTKPGTKKRWTGTIPASLLAGQTPGAVMDSVAEVVVLSEEPGELDADELDADAIPDAFAENQQDLAELGQS